MPSGILASMPALVKEICVNKIPLIKYDRPSTTDLLEALSCLIRFIVSQKGKKMKLNFARKFKGAQAIATKLISKKPSNSLAGIPKSGGVYIFYYKDGGALYIGKAKNLDRRIRNHHSAGKKDTTTALRKSVNAVYGIPFGPAMRSWFIKNCKFAYIEIPDPDMRSLTESLLIASLRTKDLLNKS